MKKLISQICIIILLISCTNSQFVSAKEKIPNKTVRYSNTCKLVTDYGLVLQPPTLCILQNGGTSTNGALGGKRKEYGNITFKYRYISRSKNEGELEAKDAKWSKWYKKTTPKKKITKMKLKRWKVYEFKDFVITYPDYNKVSTFFSTRTWESEPTIKGLKPYQYMNFV